MTERLTDKDKKVLQSKITIIHQAYFMVLMMMSIVILGGIVSFKKIPFLNHNFLASSVIFVLISVSIYGFFYLRSLKKPTANLQAGEKKVNMGLVTNKERDVKYGTSGSFIANTVLTPKLIDYYIFIDDLKLYVDKEDYLILEIGDQVQASRSIVTNELIGLEKLTSRTNT